MRLGGSPQALERHRQGTADTPLLVIYEAPRLPPTGSTAGAAFAPHRLDCGLRPLADSPSRGE